MSPMNNLKLDLALYQIKYNYYYTCILKQVFYRTRLKEFININIYINVYIPDLKK